MTSYASRALSHSILREPCLSVLIDRWVGSSGEESIRGSTKEIIYVATQVTLLARGNRVIHLGGLVGDETRCSEIYICGWLGYFC